MEISFNDTDKEGNIKNYNILMIENYNTSICKPEFNNENTEKLNTRIKRIIMKLKGIIMKFRMIISAIFIINSINKIFYC